MVPVYVLCCCTDVDDLTEGKGAEFVDRSELILIFISAGYFASPNCLRELLRALFDKKPILALTEPEAKKGGLTTEEVRAHLEEAEANFEYYGLADNMSQWGFVPPPTATDMLNALYADEVVEWNRIGLFQDVTLRLIASRMLQMAPNEVYVQGELLSKKPKQLLDPRADHHVYCSKFNVGARELMSELAQAFRFELETECLGDMSRAIASSHTAKDVVEYSSRSSSFKLTNKVFMTSEPSSLAKSDHMLLYLTSQTWTRGEESAKLGKEVLDAMNLGVHIILAHEMPGVGGQAARHGCDFGSFFACDAGTTPSELLQRGIYNEIALPLKGGEWRNASLVLLYNTLATSETVDPSQMSIAQDIADASKGLAALSQSTRRRMKRLSTGVVKLSQSARKRMGRKRLESTSTTTISVHGAEVGGTNLAVPHVPTIQATPASVPLPESPNSAGVAMVSVATTSASCTSDLPL